MHVCGCMRAAAVAAFVGGTMRCCPRTQVRGQQNASETLVLRTAPAWRCARLRRVALREHLTTSHSVLCCGVPAAKLDIEHNCSGPIESETRCTTVSRAVAKRTPETVHRGRKKRLCLYSVSNRSTTQWQEWAALYLLAGVRRSACNVVEPNPS